jgi:hypothetical protein
VLKAWTPPGLSLNPQRDKNNYPAASKTTSCWNQQIRKSGSAPNCVICVWHNKNWGQMHLPLSERPQNVAKRSHSNQSSLSSRNNTHNVAQLLQMFRKTCHLGTRIGSPCTTFFAPCSIKWIKMDQWLHRPGPWLQKTIKMFPRVLKYGPQVIKIASNGLQIQPAGLKDVLPESQWGKWNPMGRTAIQMVPTDFQIQPAGRKHMVL